jgi:hypothetical protein
VFDSRALVFDTHEAASWLTTVSPLSRENERTENTGVENIRLWSLIAHL